MNNMGKFKIGQKVVCIDDSINSTYKDKLLIKDKIYTIKDIVSCKCINYGVSIDINEYTNKRIVCSCGEILSENGDIYFLASRFMSLRKYVEQLKNNY